MAGPLKQGKLQRVMLKRFELIVLTTIIPGLDREIEKLK